MTRTDILPLAVRTVSAWTATLLIVFPLLWLVLTAFKTELQAIAVPPELFFTPTLENFGEVQQRSDYLLFAKNSVVTSVVSTLLGLLIAAPAAYSMAFFRTRKTRDRGSSSLTMIRTPPSSCRPPSPTRDMPCRPSSKRMGDRSARLSLA